MRMLALAAVLLTAAPAITAAADARPGYHPHHGRVCRTVFRHGHRVRTCYNR